MKRIFYFFFIILACTSLPAQNGVLDPSFGNNGIVMLDVNNADNASRDIAVQPDGKIVLAGYSSTSVNLFNVVRLHPDGSPDVGFGVDGIVSTELPSTSIASSIALQDDGKIVAGGHSWGGEHNQFTVVRYLSDGSLDTDFGDSGIVTTPFQDKSGFGKSLVIQDDGKIILAGIAYTLFSDLDDFALVRYQPDGRIDSTFGINGIVITNFGLSKDWINVVELQPDGKIVAGGFSDFRMAMTRYLDDGSLDQTFGDNGMVIEFVSFSSQDGINGLAFTEDGMYACGYSVDSTSNSMLAKFDYNGVRSAEFGLNGIVLNNLGVQDSYKDIKIQSDKIVLGGNAHSNALFNFAVSQLTLDGSPVTSFGMNGVLMVAPCDSFNQLEGIAIHPNGNILGAGFCQSFPYDIAVISVLTNNLVSTKEDVAALDISLYPNPTSDIIYIQGSALPSFAELQLLDLTGKVLLTIPWSSSGGSEEELKIDLHDRPVGMYFLSVRHGDRYSVYKIVKE